MSNDTPSASLPEVSTIVSQIDRLSATAEHGGAEIEGGKSADLIVAGSGDSEIDAGKGADMVVDLGGGDEIDLGKGDDTLIYSAANNVGAADAVDGGGGFDTLALALTASEWFATALQSDLARLQAILSLVSGHDHDGGIGAFDFSAFTLSVDSFEAVRIFVDGQEVSLADNAVLAADDRFSLAEGATVAGSVLANDSVADLVRSVDLVSAPSVGALTFNADGSFSFDATQGFDWLAAGQTRDVTFVYRVTDADGDTADATVTLTVTGANDAPAITGALQGTMVGGGAQTVSGRLAVSDVDIGDPLSLSLVGGGVGAPQPLYFISAAGQITAIDRAAPQVTPVDPAAQVGGSWNAAGLNPADGMIYAFVDGNALVRIDPANGQRTMLGLVSGLTGADPAAAFGPDGYMHVIQGGQFLSIDVQTQVVVGAVPLTGPVQRFLDFAYDPVSQAYLTLRNSRMYSIDGTSGQITAGPAVQGIANATGQFTDAQGHFYVAGFGLPGVYQVDPATGASSLAAPGFQGGSGDGASSFLPTGGGGEGVFGTLTLDPATQQWSYAANAAAQALAPGQTAQDVFTVQASDGHGGVVTEQIVIDVTGQAVAATLDIGIVATDSLGLSATGGQLIFSASPGSLAFTGTPFAINATDWEVWTPTQPVANIDIELQGTNILTISGDFSGPAFDLPTVFVIGDADFNIVELNSIGIDIDLDLGAGDDVVQMNTALPDYFFVHAGIGGTDSFFVNQSNNAGHVLDFSQVTVDASITIDDVSGVAYDFEQFFFNVDGGAVIGTALNDQFTKTGPASSAADFRGGDGDDVMDVASYAVTEGDAFDGGAGFDKVTVRSYADGVGDVIDLRGVTAGTGTGVVNGASVNFASLEQVTLLGGSDSAVIFGSSGFDLIAAGAGDDRVASGAGDDGVGLASGGADTFVFAAGDGFDHVSGFDANAGAGHDVIELQGLVTSFAEVLTVAHDTGFGATQIDFGGGDAITLQGVSVAQLSVDDFLFA